MKIVDKYFRELVISFIYFSVFNQHKGPYINDVLTAQKGNEGVLKFVTYLRILLF